MNWRRHQPVASAKNLALATSAALTYVEASHADPLGRPIGAGWTRTSKGGHEFVSLKLDKSRFPAPIYANSIERNGQHKFIWSR